MKNALLLYVPGFNLQCSIAFLMSVFLCDSSGEHWHTIRSQKITLVRYHGIEIKILVACAHSRSSALAKPA